eukprot:s4434_g1.t1
MHSFQRVSLRTFSTAIGYWHSLETPTTTTWRALTEAESIVLHQRTADPLADLRHHGSRHHQALEAHVCAKALDAGQASWPMGTEAFCRSSQAPRVHAADCHAASASEALTYREVKMIVMQRLIKIDGKVRTDMFYPAGFMDMVQIDKTKDNFRLLYNTKGRFNLHKVAKEEASYKLCRVKRVTRGPRGVPYAQTHDGRTIRYPDPDIKAFRSDG